jgi:hypothetical protein
MTVQLQTVPNHFVAQVWPQVEEFIARSEKHSGGDYSMDQIRMYVNLGLWWLVVAVEDQQIKGAMTGSFINYPNDRVAFITATGGEGICTEDTLNQLREILKAQGATKIQAGGREAMVRMLRMLGFTHRYAVVETHI